MSFTFFDEQAPQLLEAVLFSYNYSVPQALAQFLNNALRIDVCWALNTDSAANVVTLMLGTGELTSVNVPARAGFDGTAPADLLVHLAALQGWQGLIVPAQSVINIKAATAPGDGEVITVILMGGLVPALVGL